MNINRKHLALIVGLVTISLTILAGDAKAFPNGKIAFASGGVIYIMNADGSGTTPLPTNGSADFPSFSPDGRRIAFSGDIGGNFGIHVIDADGNNLRFLTTASSYQDRRGMSWSPDGKKIAFTCAQLGRICVINTDGTHRTVIDEDSRDYGPDWSPDGSKIAFTKTLGVFGLTDEIHVMDADGDHQKRLTTNRFPDVGPRWSPDSAKLVFTHRNGCLVLSNREVLCFASYVYTINAVDGSNPTLLAGGDVFEGGFAADPGWAPNGRKIIFWGTDMSPNPTSNDIFVINSDGSGLANLTNTADFSEHAPDWGKAFSPVAGDFDLDDQKE